MFGNAREVMDVVKRFYYGLVSLRYSFLLVGIPLVIFFLAFAGNKKHGTPYSLPMLLLTIVLAIVMAVYYRHKFLIARTLKKVDQVDEFLSGGMLDRSYILEDRMLAGIGLTVSEQKTTGIKKMVVEDKGRKVVCHVFGSDGEFAVSCLDMNEAQRFAAFLKRKNPDIELNVEPVGTGSLKELGA